MSQESIEDEEYLDEEKGMKQRLCDQVCSCWDHIGAGKCDFAEPGGSGQSGRCGSFFEVIQDFLNLTYSDQFYIHFFEVVYPQIDFQQLKGAQTIQEQGDNIQTLIDLLGQKILKVDLEHIKGEEIVNGNPEHCINLLQLIYQLSMGINEEGGGSPNDGKSSSKRDTSNKKGMIESSEKDQSSPSPSS